MKLNKLKICLIVVVFLLIIALIVLSIVTIFNSGIDYISYVSGISSVFAAILTALYVYTTSKQIEMTRKQIEEMELERKTTQQPLLFNIDDKLTIERPNFYFSPPNEEYSIQSRYFYKLKVKNDSDNSAVLIDVGAKLLIRQENDIFKMDSCFQRINMLASNHTSEELDFMFVQDTNLKFFSALREFSAYKLPVLKLSMIYKNMNGGCFQLSQYFTIVVNEEYEDTLRKWQKIIVSAQADAKEILQVISKLDSHSSKHDELFQKVRKAIEEQTDGIEELELSLKPIPELFNLSMITDEEYKKKIDNHYYSHFVNKEAICK